MTKTRAIVCWQSAYLVPVYVAIICGVALIVAVWIASSAIGPRVDRALDIADATATEAADLARPALQGYAALAQAKARSAEFDLGSRVTECGWQRVEPKEPKVWRCEERRVAR
jgi:hypothetical protein